MTKSRSLLFTLVIASLLVVGCASGGGGGAKGPSDDELINQLVNTVVDALKSEDVATAMSYYADDFSGDQGDRAAMQAFLEQAQQGGFLSGMTSDLSAMAVSIDGASATVSGVAVEGAFGVLDLGFELEKRDGAWVITSQTQQ